MTHGTNVPFILMHTVSFCQKDEKDDIIMSTTNSMVKYSFAKRTCVCVNFWKLYSKLVVLLYSTLIYQVR